MELKNKNKLCAVYKEQNLNIIIQIRQNERMQNDIPHKQVGVGT